MIFVTIFFPIHICNLFCCCFFFLFLCEGKYFGVIIKLFMEMVWKFFFKKWKCLCMINLIYEEKLSHHFFAL